MYQQVLNIIERIFIEYNLETFKRYYSKYRGRVERNDDPDFRGRIQISCSAVYGDAVYKYWALPCGLPSGGAKLFAIPNVGDMVWVEFEGGDPRFPIWSWGWFIEGAVPKSAQVDGDKIAATVYQSASGHRIVMNDKDDTLTISNASGLNIVLTKDSLELVGAGQKAVKGDTLKTVLDTLITILKTSTDTLGNPFNPATITALTNLKTDIILSDKVKLQ